MKLLMWLITLIGFGYVGNYLYEEGYFDSLLESFNNTVERTSDFVDDTAVKKTDF